MTHAVSKTWKLFVLCMQKRKKTDKRSSTQRLSEGISVSSVKTHCCLYRADIRSTRGRRGRWCPLINSDWQTSEEQQGRPPGMNQCAVYPATETRAENSPANTEKRSEPRAAHQAPSAGQPSFIHLHPWQHPSIQWWTRPLVLAFTYPSHSSHTDVRTHRHAVY